MNTEDKIIQKLLEHDARFDQVVTKKEFNEFREQYSDDRDEMLTILRRLDQERIFTAEWIRRIEDEVKIHSQELSRVKLQLKIA